MKQLLSDFNSEEIREALDIPPYKAKQIFRWLAKGCDFAEMSDQSKAFRETLQENYFAQGVKIIKRFGGRNRKISFCLKRWSGCRGRTHEIQVRQHSVRFHSGRVPHGMRFLRKHLKRS